MYIYKQFDILSILSILGIQNISLYQDDGLVSLYKISGPAFDKIRKDIIETFWENFCSKRTINTKVVNFLDGTFDLCTARYQPCKKPNDIPTYFSVNSNHTPNIIKALPDRISKRISNISSDKATFSNAATFYNDALSGSGYKENLTYYRDLPHYDKVRQRKIIQFSPPYIVNVETNIGKTFLKLIDKHFPKTNKCHKIFNRNNVKVSYSCLSNFCQDDKITQQQNLV